MDNGEILRVLSRMNTWWGGEAVPISLKKADHRRKDFFHLRKRISNDRPVLTIRGPRQVGKTTIVGQLIEDLLDSSLPNDHILYINAENTNILPDTENVISDSLDIYQRSVLGRSFRDIEERVFVFIDEIQKIENWASTVKYFTDTFSNLKFVVTGSVSTLIREDASETLVGRLDEYLIMPMKFVEYVRYFDILDDSTVLDHTLDARRALKNAVRDDDPSHFTTELTRFYGLHSEDIPRFESLCGDYLLKGGYPGVLDTEFVDAFAILDSNLRNTVTGDIPSVFESRKPEKMLELLNLAAYSSGQKFSVRSLRETLNVDRETVERYLHYLNEFFLVSRLPKFSGSEYGGRGREKIFIDDVGLLNTLNANLAPGTLDNSDSLGQILETACHDHCKRLQFYISGHQTADIGYWTAGGEVDFILSGSEYCLPIEVKNGDSTTADLSGLREFISNYGIEFGIAVNNAGKLQETELDGASVVHIPAWLFFFIC